MSFYEVIHDVQVSKKSLQECYAISQWLIENNIEIKKLEITENFSDTKMFNLRAWILNDDQYISFKLRWN